MCDTFAHLSPTFLLGFPWREVGKAMTELTQPEPMFEQAIRQRAYQLYVERGMVAGHALEDWLQAEAELVQGLKY
jgi:Protein of unknown function (DUF2934)